MYFNEFLCNKSFYIYIFIFIYLCYLINGTIFRQNVILFNNILISSTILSEIFLSLRKIK